MKAQVHWLAAVAALASAGAAPSAPLPSGLSISVARSSFQLGAATGGATQGGVAIGTFGGADSTNDSGAFTQTGDRIGTSLAAFGTFGGNAAGTTAGLFGRDYGITLTNASAVDIEVALQALVLNRVAASGGDAYAKSAFVVRQGQTELFFSDFRIDTFNTGPSNNFTQASPNNLLTLLILANSSLQLSASQEIEAGAYVGGASFDTSLDAALRLESARVLGALDTGPGNAVPLPGTWALLLAALPGLALTHRRSRCHPALVLHAQAI